MSRIRNLVVTLLIITGAINLTTDLTKFDLFPTLFGIALLFAGYRVLMGGRWPLFAAIAASALDLVLGLLGLAGVWRASALYYPVLLILLNLVIVAYSVYLLSRTRRARPVEQMR